MQKCFSLISLLALLSGCCAPDACYVARTRFTELDPVTTELLLYEQQHGHFPATLEEAFADGLPTGIHRDSSNYGIYTFTRDRGGFGWVSYDKLSSLGLAEPSPVGLAKEEYALSFSYVGGGIIGFMNRCIWATDLREWNCYGYM